MASWMCAEQSAALMVECAVSRPSRSFVALTRKAAKQRLRSVRGGPSIGRHRPSPDLRRPARKRTLRASPTPYGRCATRTLRPAMVWIEAATVPDRRAGRRWCA